MRRLGAHPEKTIMRMPNALVISVRDEAYLLRRLLLSPQYLSVHHKATVGAPQGSHVNTMNQGSTHRVTHDNLWHPQHRVAYATRALQLCDVLGVKRTLALTSPAKNDSDLSPTPQYGEGSAKKVRLDHNATLSTLDQGSQIGFVLVKSEIHESTHIPALLPHSAAATTVDTTMVVFDLLLTRTHRCSSLINLSTGNNTFSNSH